jgi:hypothetical protein
MREPVAPVRDSTRGSGRTRVPTRVFCASLKDLRKAMDMGLEGRMTSTTERLGVGASQGQ